MKLAVPFTKPVRFIDCCSPASFYSWLKLTFIDESLAGGMAIEGIDEMSTGRKCNCDYCEIPLENLF